MSATKDTAPVGGKGLRVGASRAVITPPLGVSLAGSYSDRRAVGYHDDLYARAFVAGSGDDGASHLAVVSCDLIGVRAATVSGARRRVEQACGILGSHVLIAATHNHSGPLTRELVAGGLAGETDEAYVAQLERHIAAAVEDACRRRAPAGLRLSVGRESGLAFNRRFVMHDGPVRTNPGKQNPDVRRAAGPVDERVWTVTALPEAEGIPADGSASVPPSVVPLALLVNFGLHPAIVAGTIIGGEYPAYLEAGVQRLLGAGGPGLAVAPGQPGHGAALPGGQPVVVFANAPCGDINHLDVSHPQQQGGFAEAARVGTVLAAEAVKCACRLVPDLQVTQAACIRAARQVVEVPLRRPTPEQVTWARDAARGRMTMVPGQGLEVVEAHRILSLAEGWSRDTKSTEAQALAIGDDLAIVGLPGEVFAELGLELRHRSPFRHTLVLGLANEALGYVPTHRAYQEGGYELAASRLQPGSGERLVDEAVELLRRCANGSRVSYPRVDHDTPRILRGCVGAANSPPS